jgi:hypothetical protein
MGIHLHDALEPAWGTAQVMRRSLLDRLPAGGQDHHVGDSGHSAASSYGQEVALRELGTDKACEHVAIEPMGEHKHFLSGAAWTTGE